jgi:AraC-like DNA-binding protein
MERFFMASGAYVLGSLAKMLLAYIDSRNLVLPVLQANLLKRTPTEQIPIEYWWEWLEVVQQADFRPAVGVHIGRHAKPHHMGLLGYLLLSCDDGTQALDYFQRFQPLLHSLSPSSIYRHNDRLRINWDYSFGTSTQISSEVLVSAFLTNTKNFVGDKEVIVYSVSFPGSPPSNSDQYDDILGCPVEFSAKNLGLELQAKWLDEKIPTADSDLRQVLELHADSLMEVTPRPDPFLKALEINILRAIPQGDVSASAIANILDMPLRSFYRRLDQRSINYRHFLQTLRYQLAKQYLANSQLELAEISQLLGYSEQSAFGRAFKQWHGATPNRYRRLIELERSRPQRES